MKEPAKKFTLREIAELTGAELVGNPDHLISGADTLECSDLEDASFLANSLYREAMLKTKAGVICVDRNLPLIPEKNFLISDSPTLTFQKIVQFFFNSDYNESGFKGIHPSAIIHPDAKIATDVSIGPQSVIDRGVEIGSGTCIGPLVSIGPGVKIGENCILHSNSVVRERCELRNRVIIQPGAVIGSCGFGYATDSHGRHIKLEQLGKVIIEDDVEIGANTTIDRARFKNTYISQGSKIDNLVQIGHNVVLGPNNIIVSQTGIAGSVKTGRNVVMGGQVGVVGHIEITDGVMIAAKGGVSKSMTTPGKYAGVPVMSLKDYNRQQVQLRKIGDYVKKIEELELRLKELETSSSTHSLVEA